MSFKSFSQFRWTFLYVICCVDNDVVFVSNYLCIYQDGFHLSLSLTQRVLYWYLWQRTRAMSVFIVDNIAYGVRDQLRKRKKEITFERTSTWDCYHLTDLVIQTVLWEFVIYTIFPQDIHALGKKHNGWQSLSIMWENADMD